MNPELMKLLSSFFYAAAGCITIIVGWQSFNKRKIEEVKENSAGRIALEKIRLEIIEKQNEIELIRKEQWELKKYVIEKEMEFKEDVMDMIYNRKRKQPEQ